MLLQDLTRSIQKAACLKSFVAELIHANTHANGSTTPPGEQKYTPDLVCRTPACLHDHTLQKYIISERNVPLCTAESLPLSATKSLNLARKNIKISIITLSISQQQLSFSSASCILKPFLPTALWGLLRGLNPCYSRHCTVPKDHS